MWISGFLLASAMAAPGQYRFPGLDAHGSVRGEISADQPIALDALVVELVDTLGQRAVARVPVSTNGIFEIDGIEEGQYTMRITTLWGAVLKSEFVFVQSLITPVSVRLELPPAERPASGTVSLAALSHKVPAKARKEFERSLKALEKEDEAASIRHLERALEIDPEYMQAHNNLGVRYMALEQYQEAEEHFRRAVELDPGSQPAQANLASALLQLKMPADAEQAARRAVELDSSSSKARFLLGLSLLGQGKADAEAIDALRKAGGEFPKAYLAAAQALASQGDIPAAGQELQKYLASGEKDKRAEVESWLASLNTGGH